VVDIWLFHPDTIWSHRALCVKQFMAKSRRTIYRCTAHHIILETVPLQHSVAPFLCKLYSYSHYLYGPLLAAHFSKIYIINKTISIFWTLPLGCNWTGICTLSSFDELYSNNFWVLAVFFTFHPLVRRCWRVWEIRQLVDDKRMPQRTRIKNRSWGCQKISGYLLTPIVLGFCGS